MNFLSPTFLPALLAGALPLVIHLLNRRRVRPLDWAAMDFLREAVARNRRAWVLRDLLLLVLRTAAVLLFVLAMARPYVPTGRQSGVPTGGVHAVLVIDNSLSMAYTQLDRTLLDTAKDKAAEFIRRLPAGSKVSLAPACGVGRRLGKDVYATADDALEALSRIEIVDRQASAGQACELAARACRALPALPTKRVVFISDMQVETWGARDLGAFFGELPDVQIVQVGPARRTNTWVADLRLREGLACAEAPAVFVATVRHDGPEPRPNVQVAFRINGEAVAQRRVDLLPGQNLQVTFEHRFDVAGTPARPLYAAARVELTPDRLRADDFRTLVVPVVSRLPVVFVDSLGPDEDPSAGRYGETLPARRLLAPKTAGSSDAARLVEVRHRQPADLSQDDLKDARLAVLAGVGEPTSEMLELLEQYVRQGGMVLIAAGDGFDPGAWQASAWRSGTGILPAPLRPRPVGKLPAPEAVDAATFGLAGPTLTDPVFHLDLPPGDLADIVAGPFFFKAVAVDDDAMDDADGPIRGAIERRRKALADYDAKERRWARLERDGKLTDTDRTARDAARDAAKALRPTWLAWSAPADRRPDAMGVDELLRRSLPRVMGRYDTGQAFAVRRDVGCGRVVLVTTGLMPKWNSLAADQGVLLLDAILRDLLARSMPSRTLQPVREVVVPVDSADLGAAFTILAPGEAQPRPISVEALSANTYGLIARDVHRRGLYRIRRAADPADGSTRERSWAMTLAINGPGSESGLAAVSEREFCERMGSAGFRWIEPSEAIRLSGTTFIGYDFWKTLLVAVMLCLAAEMFLLARPGPGGGRP